MSTPSRFRTGQVSAPATAAERLRRLLGDGDRLVETGVEIVEQLTREPATDQLLDVLAVIREHDDPHRVYLLHRMAASCLVAASASHRDDLGWAAFFDAVVAGLVPQLESNPHEPELLNLLGLAWYELGETSLARRLFEAVRLIEPEHLQARSNIKSCKEREQRGGVAKVSADHARRAAALHAASRHIADAAARLPERTISLCMIVKDEEEMLPGCLEAAAPWVDQLIVVDTGSADRTREIAESFGATVIDFPWTGSFSDARNRSIEDATGDWILYLDADEHLVDDDGKHLKKLARKTWIEAFYLVENHYTGEFDNGGQTTHMALRLFQRRPQYRWEGIVHEQKMRHFPVYLPERFANAPVRMNHYGYLRRVVEDRDKRERNLSLLMRQLEEREDAFTHFNIASEYGAMRDWAGSRPHFERALELARSTDRQWFTQQFAPMMVSRAITARRHTGDPGGAIELIDEGMGYWPAFTDLIFERASIHAEHGRLDEAMEDVEQCLAMGDAPAQYVAVKGKGSFEARALLGALLRRQGDTEGAREQMARAFDEAPHYLPLVLELADVMLLTDPPSEVANWIETRLGERAGTPHALLLLAAAFHESGHLDDADRYYERVIDQQPGNIAARIGRAELALAQRRPEDSLDVISDIDQLDPNAPRAARTWFLSAVVADRPDELAQPLSIIQSAEYLPIGVRSFYSAWHARIMGQDAVLAADPAAAAQAGENLEALAKLESADAFEQLVPVLEQALPDERERRKMLGMIYLRRKFADMALEEFLYIAQTWGPDPEILSALGKVATMKELWDDARVFLAEALEMDPDRDDARRLLDLIAARAGE